MPMSRIVLFQATPYLSGLCSDHRIIPGSIIQGPVEQSGSDHALFQGIGVVLQPVLDNEAKKLFSAHAGAKVLAFQNLMQSFRNLSERRERLRSLVRGEGGEGGRIDMGKWIIRPPGV